LILTGRLGDWLKESAQAGFTYVRARATALNLDSDFHENYDFHIHYPGNPLRTDGPSAGIAMATSIVSALTGRAVRADTAMTGEISLRGRVLQIGGVKDKLLAAHRAGVARVLIPEENRPDLDELPQWLKETLEILPVSHMDQVLLHALVEASEKKIGVPPSAAP
jgi:ATP-dependent Lon protease